ncbi:16S rRNA (guanine(527)-N(7))-methyltransferase RsmG, partial [Cronobacter sakazakii]|uniref:16S rRNA (guanine(527)-N(7))-methyltransferase RsmG n=1 Tax=Cronobacter sakazakii TaxID=28141 RepID=UPI001EED55EA
MLNTLTRLLDDAGITLPEHQKAQLVAYVDMLNKWNKAYNLTSVRDPNEMLVRHIMDSIVVEPHLKGTRFIDVGTGPGLPGIPLAIVRPDSHFTLLDSLGKRVRFLRQVQHELKLDNITPVQSRVEAFPAEPPFDGVISRAFASLSDMVNWCHHLPQLGIANLRVREQLLEIGSQQLAFTHQEARQFFDCRLSQP